MQTAFRSEERFTQAEFQEWLQERPADDINHYELFDGHIVMSPPAGFRHAKLDCRIGSLLLSHVTRLGLGHVLGSSAGYNLPSGDTLEPDVSFVSHARMAAGPEQDPARFCGIVPDLVIEILSPTTAERDRTEKKEIYARNGAGEYWLVDGDRHEVTVFYREGASFSSARILRSGRIESRVLPDLRLTVGAVFADLA